MPRSVYNQDEWIMNDVPICTHLDIGVIAVVDGPELLGRTGEKFPLMQHPVRERPGLHLSNRCGIRVGIDGKQIDLTSDLGTQSGFRRRHDSRCQWTSILTP